MPFCFKRHEPVSDGFRRIVGAELHEVQLLLCAAAADQQPDQAVHDARRRLKKVRALLRLLRKPLGKDFCEDQVHALSEVADRLAPARDARVRLAALETIAEEADSACAAPIAKLRGSYSTHLRRAEQQSLDRKSLGDLQTALTATLAALAAAPLEDADWKLLNSGIKRMARRVRKARATAEHEGGTTAFHDWRKRTKDMQYQMRLFQPVCPQEMKRLDRRLERLNEVLGQDHDMAMLETSLRGKGRAFVQSTVGATLLGTIARRRQKLQRQALRHGDKLLPEKPQQFTQRLAQQWRDWRKGQ